ncbi:MAG: FKBP-type peptidyl-prolyl cis-trans isomerase [Methanoculleus sp.]|nr:MULTISPECIES: FKBP-type peptidyl-prolyl cis-trans isomerase [unclassified Methanoculleus]MCK9317088.1 FKBP-type peptidyl-prolyl cis-trans isomerase [Methanoculleus sp.]MDD2253421.1 FKBP-type peptidyl-prolyl cis-trans isomerase [Methanoculleus sp.]MDD2787173.1 FKBP-type peptidyl-prolyl cis-trans isomerase [Methanoculleus sp.]MDD3215000.1 FKBP-type peptidyl-prolyl cis-trans isomerase [Methanoculleus sp.]MDD4313974.1 FKBP-type peptidyl-prolyl cis-trans isomerase [Methanoculleus sp.]
MRRKQVYSVLLIACALILASGCVASDGGQAVVKPGDTVRVHYTGTLENGTVFDSSAGREPLEFVVGSNAVIPGFDAGVVGMQVGETKTIHVPVDQAYGPHREELVFVADPAEIPGGENLTVGDQVGITLSGGQVLPGRVAGVSPDAVTIDANHHLAGVDLTFTVTLVEIG